MLVVDASAFTELVAWDSPSSTRVRAVLGTASHWVTTEHFVAEVANSFRKLWLRRDLTDAQLDRALAALAEVPFDVWPTKPLLPRIRELIHNVTAYDAAYVALAEELGAPLVTLDAKLAKTPGARCRFLGPE